MSSGPITWDDIDRHLGIQGSVSEAEREPFLRAGFSEEAATRGADLMRSGRYLGFEDVALSMTGAQSFTGDAQSIAEFNSKNPGATTARIAEVARQLGGRRVIEERRTPSQTRPRIVESAQATAVGEGCLEVQVISEGQGSSGYYPASTLEEAAAAKVFSRGLHCYLDHPSATDAIARPERSVRDLAGCLESDAIYRGGSLLATVRVFPDFREFIAERASVIGMSIRADGEVTESKGGTATVTRLVKAHSLDFVTHAGRGGRILS